MMAELFEDFAERSQRDSESLLQQLSALNVGPLVTYDAGQDISTRADLTELSNSFELI
jgi:DNA polymerase III gamma/tau subunit